MLWKSKTLDLNLLKSIIPDVIVERNNFPTHNPSSQSGTAIRTLLSDAVHCIDYQNDFKKVTEDLIYNVAEYEACIESIEGFINLNILPDIL